TTQSIDISRFLSPQGGVVPQTVGTIGPSMTTGACASNPCNPYCVGYDVDAGALSAGSFVTTGSVQGSIKGYSDWPTAKQNAMDPTAGWCPMALPAPSSGTYSYRECNYDYCCATPDGGGATGTCTRFIDQPDSGVCYGQTTPGTSYPVPVGAGTVLG